jgi:small conductance mechanosensitive channel
LFDARHAGRILMHDDPRVVFGVALRLLGRSVNARDPAVLRQAAERVAAAPEHQGEFLEPPTVVGVEQLTVDGAVIRTIAKTTADARPTVQRALRQALTESLEDTGLSERIAASRLMPRPAVPPDHTRTEPESPEGGS